MNSISEIVDKWYKMKYNGSDNKKRSSMCMLVILEGLDNTGKTTIAKMLM